MSFLVRPILEDCEGPRAFVLRVAEANMLPVRHVLELGIDACWPCVAAALDRLQPISRRSSAFCPRCLGERRVGLVSWEITFADACPRCGSWLVDVCGDCGTTLDWLRNDLAHCPCGKRLTLQEAAIAPPALVKLSRRFEASLLSSTEDGDWMSRLSTDQLARLVRLLGTYGASDGRRTPQKGTFAAGIAASWQVSSLAAEVLAAWPRSFHSYLDRLVARDGSGVRSGSLHRTFGGFYFALYHAFSAAEFAPIRDAFEGYVLDHWTGALGDRNRRFGDDFLRRASWLPANRVCSQAGVSRKRLESLVIEGKVRGSLRSTPAGRSFLVVHRDDAACLALSVREEETLAHAARALGLKRSRLAALLPIICPRATRQTDERSPWAIPRAWVAGWLDRLGTFNAMLGRPGLVSLDHILRFRSWPDARIARLLIGVECGDVPVAGRVDGAPGLPSLLFNESALEPRAATTQFQTTALTIPEVAARLGIKQEVAYFLVRQGLLASTTRRGSSRLASFVSETQLMGFADKFIWGRDVAYALGRSPKATAAGLRGAGIAAVSGPGIDGGRQLLFLRDQVSRALLVDLPVISLLPLRPDGGIAAPTWETVEE